MEGVFGILVILGFLALLIYLGHLGKKENEKHQIYIYKQIEDEVKFQADKFSLNLKDEITPHLDTLLIKRQQLIYKDDYGHEVHSEWFKELHYFVDNISGSELREFSGDEFLINQIDGQVFIYGVKKRTEVREKSAAYDEDMSGTEFEKLVANIFQKLGGVIKHTPITGDQGADLLVLIEGRSIAIQCKRSSSSIGNKAVQEALSGKHYYDAEEAWVVSDAQFTRQARQLASSLDVELVDFRLIAETLSSR